MTQTSAAVRVPDSAEALSGSRDCGHGGDRWEADLRPSTPDIRHRALPATKLLRSSAPSHEHDDKYDHEYDYDSPACPSAPLPLGPSGISVVSMKSHTEGSGTKCRFENLTEPRKWLACARASATSSFPLG